MTDMKAERLQLRIDDESKRQLEEAAAAAHLTVTSFVLQAAKQRADDVLADRALLRLSEPAATAFADALEAPAAVNAALLEALRRPVKVEWID